MNNNMDLLNQIDECVIESEIAVCESMLNAYQKAQMILESYEGDDVSSFDIFTESFYMEDGEEKTEEKQSVGSKILSILKKIIFFVPNLVIKAIQAIKNKFSKKDKTADTAETITNTNTETKEEADKAIEVISESESVEEVVKIAKENGASKEEIEKIKITYKEAKKLETKIMELFFKNGYISPQQKLNADGHNILRNGLKGVVNLKKCAFVNLQKDPRICLKAIDEYINFAKEIEKILKKPIGDLWSRIEFADKMVLSHKVKSPSEIFDPLLAKKKKSTKTHISITFAEYKKFVEDVNKKFDELKTITDRTFNAYTIEDVKKIAKDSSMNKEGMEEKLQQLSSVMIEFGQATTKLINGTMENLQPFDLTFEYIDKYIIDKKGARIKAAAIAGGGAVGVVGLSFLARLVIGKVKGSKHSGDNEIIDEKDQSTINEAYTDIVDFFETMDSIYKNTDKYLNS